MNAKEHCSGMTYRTLGSSSVLVKAVAVSWSWKDLGEVPECFRRWPGRAVQNGNVYLRYSIQAFNSQEELDYLYDSLKELLDSRYLNYRTS
jgi:selenocysteine lyase/cysteine desulfurase